MIPTIRSLLGTLPQAFLSQYLRSILPDCQPVFGGPRAPLTLHCEFKLGRNICDYNRCSHTFINLLIDFIFPTYFSYMRLRTYYLLYWFILCSRGYIESKKKVDGNYLKAKMLKYVAMEKYADPKKVNAVKATDRWRKGFCDRYDITLRIQTNKKSGSAIKRSRILRNFHWLMMCKAVLTYSDRKSWKTHRLRFT